MVKTEQRNGKKRIYWAKQDASTPDLTITFNTRGQLDNIRIEFEEKIDKTVLLDSLPQIASFLRDSEMEELGHGEHTQASIVVEPEYGGVTIFNFHNDPVLPNIKDNQALVSRLGELLAIPESDMARLRGRVRLADRTGSSRG